jgi:hypothetical protein
MQSEAAAQRIARDKKQAESVGFQGTPLIYINGREFDSRGDFATELEDWIRLDLELAGEPMDAQPAPAPKATVVAPGSAAPSAAPSGPKQ